MMIRDVRPWRVALAAPALLFLAAAVGVADDDASAARDLVSKGDSLYKQNRYDQAARAYEGALALDPRCAAAHRGKADVLRMTGRFEPALKAYDEAVRLDDRSALTFRGRADALNALGKHHAAAKDCDRALELDPNYAQAYRARGDVRAN